MTEFYRHGLAEPSSPVCQMSLLTAATASFRRVRVARSVPTDGLAPDRCQTRHAGPDPLCLGLLLPQAHTRTHTRLTPPAAPPNEAVGGYSGLGSLATDRAKRLASFLFAFLSLSPVTPIISSSLQSSPGTPSRAAALPHLSQRRIQSHFIFLFTTNKLFWGIVLAVNRNPRTTCCRPLRLPPDTYT